MDHWSFRMILLMGCLITLVHTAASDGGPRHHCIHGDIVKQSPPLYFIPQHQVQPSSPRRRAMSTQSTTWHKIRFLFNYSYVDDPGMDQYHAVTSEVMHRSCTVAGESLKIGGSPLTTLNCTAPDGTLEYVNGCLLYCRPEDVVTPTLVTTLKGIVDQVVNKFTQMISVPDTATNDVTIQADTSQNDCFGQTVDKMTIATDFVVYVTMRPLRLQGNTLAFARACALDPSTNRPILGHMNVAPSTLATGHELQTVLLHELTHALGFSPSLFPLMRHPQNSSLTYRQFDPVAYPTGPVSGDGIVVEGGNGSTFSIDYRLLGPTKKLKIISPNVVAWARQYFNCPTLDGVELENGANSSASTASHWEKRTMFFEYMVSDQNYEAGRVSNFTLAYLNDMGFYKVDTSLADSMDWGAAAGCEWATGDCGTAWPSNYACSDVQTASCGYNRKFSGICNLQNYVSDLPVGYQHIPGFPKRGGEDEYADRCPIVVTYVTNGNGAGPCADPSNFPTDQSVNYFGVRTGSSSRCFMSSAAVNNRAADMSSRCFQVVCNGSGVPHARIGQQFFPCADGEIFELLFPPRSLSSAKKAPSVAKYYVNWEMAGIFQCGTNLTAMCNSGEIYSASVVDWATINSITPRTGDVDGGTTVTVHGSGLSKCSALRIGGVFAKNVSVHSDTNMTAVTAKVEKSSQLGGSGSDGDGAVDVELFCNLSTVCPEGCIVGRLVNKFNYTVATFDLFSAVNLFSDFMGSTIGKVVGGGVGLIVVLILCFVFRSCVSDGDAGSSFDGGKGSSTSKRRRMGHNPGPGAQRRVLKERPNLSRFEEELL